MHRTSLYSATDSCNFSIAIPPCYPFPENRDQALQVLQEILTQLKTYGVRNGAVFGSVVQDNAGSTSDIDILLDFDTEAESFDNLMNVADLLDGRFDSLVGSVTVNGLNPYVAAAVHEEAVHAEAA